MPAVALVGGYHTCPKFKELADGEYGPPPPHVGGPTLGPGTYSAAVRAKLTPLLGKVKFEDEWARVTTVLDKAECEVEGPDFVIQGSSTITLGGLPISRVGDQTSHGDLDTINVTGVLTEGFDLVEVGGDPITLMVKQGVSDNFLNDLRRDLRKIFSTRSGGTWLEKMAKTNARVLFSEGGSSQTHPTGDPIEIEWNTSEKVDKNAGFDDNDGTSDVVLFHEMCHALHRAEAGGVIDMSDDALLAICGFNEIDGRWEWGTQSIDEERYATGTSNEGVVYPPVVTAVDAIPECSPSINGYPVFVFGDDKPKPPTDYSSYYPSENSYRDETGKDDRETYLSQQDIEYLEGILAF